MDPDSSASTDLRSRILGAAIAGGGAIVVLLVLTALEFGSPAAQTVLAIVVGIAVAQLYEQRFA